MKSKQVYKNHRKPVQIDAGLHQLLKIKATEQGMTIKTFLEEYLAEVLAVEAVEIKCSKKKNTKNDKIMKLKS
jgi:hypothetical protein